MKRQERINMKKLKSIIIFSLWLLPILGLFLVQPAAQPVAASAGQNAIAYVLPNDTTGDEIHLINPDGTHDREIWRTGTSGVTTSPDVAQLTWKPDASELAFWSRFQEDCSFYNGDIYAIRADGTNLHRVTAPPACRINPGLPTGSVNLDVVNNTGSGMTVDVYVEGAPGPKFATLSGYGSETVTFTNVIDYGDGVPQWAVAIYGEDRYTSVLAHADVIPAQTVSTDGPLYMDFVTTYWGWGSPTYNSDGSEMAYIFGSSAIYHTPSTNTNPGGVGWKLLNLPDGVIMPGSPKLLQWGSGSHAHQLLYEGLDWDAIGAAIYLVNEGSTDPGTEVLLVDDDNSGKTVLGLTWLPDGSGFLYSGTETDWTTYTHFGNIFEYKFATKTSTRLTSFTSGYPRELTISPDGKKVVFEYQATGDWSDSNISIDLWMMNRDGSGAAVFVKNGQSPAWSPSALPVYRYTYLPFLRK
jgi:hypothetical protein